MIGPEFFREMATVIDAAEGSPPDRAKMRKVMRRYGLTPVPPPSGSGHTNKRYLMAEESSPGIIFLH
jgi:hypothetical protein